MGFDVGGMSSHVQQSVHPVHGQPSRIYKILSQYSYQNFEFDSGLQMCGIEMFHTWTSCRTWTSFESECIFIQTFVHAISIKITFSIAFSK